MIPRYTRKEMAALWSDEYKFNKMLEIEILACEAMEKFNIIPEGVAEKIRQSANVNVKKIQEIEKITRHDIAAFVQQISQTVPKEVGKYIHFGLTSSDVIDTAFSCQLRDAGKLLLKGLVKLRNTVKKLALKYKYTPTIGRTHGIHAEPITFGLKLLSFYSEINRNIQRLKDAIKEISYGKLSGVVGSYTQLPPNVEKYVCSKLNLKPEPISTQVIPRDRYAYFIFSLSLISSCLERLALEIRHLQRTEIQEVEEPFGEGQKGSSAMPHKRNPVLSENICGLSRIIRNNIIPALENIPLWHERDISHSSAERIIFPQSTILLDFAIHRMIEILSKLRIYPDRMRNNLEKSLGNIFSQRLMLELINKGLSRSEAYKIVQQICFEAKEKNVEFKTLVFSNDTIMKYFNKNELEELFSINSYFKYVDYIFRRVLKD
jgi:adenylosuccinate lyase